MYRENALKRKLREGRPALGCWLGLASPVAAEVMGLVGYDFAMIDNEHGPATLTESVGMLQALSATPATALVRVPWNDPVYVKRILDIGAEGLMFPAIGSAVDAAAAVAACRYPPAGNRGSAYGIARGASYGLAGEGYLRSINDNLLVICQIESLQAVDAIPEIAAVEGVDMLFVGPYDLSGSMGKLGQLDDPEVRAVRLKAERSILDSGKWLGTIAIPGRTAERCVADGCRLVLAGHDLAFMRDGALAQVRRFAEAVVVT